MDKAIGHSPYNSNLPATYAGPIATQMLWV